MRVEDFISKYYNMSIEVAPNVTYDLRKIINDCHLVLNAQYERNPVEASGYENMKTRKEWVVLRTFLQGVDLDTKDAKISSNYPTRQFVLSLLRMIYNSHFNQTFFGEKIDEIKDATITFGSAIVKRYDGQIGVVDLRNYVTEPRISDPQKRRHVEYWPCSWEALQQYKDEWKNWDEVEILWEHMSSEGVSEFNIVDFWTWEDIDGKTHKVCKRYVDRSLYNQEDSYRGIENGSFIEVDTFKTPYKLKSETEADKKKYGDYREMFPYEQIDLFKFPGRGLGVGVLELLRSVSIMYDMIFNLKAKMSIKALYGVIVYNAIIDPRTGTLSSLTQEQISSLVENGVVTIPQGASITNLRLDQNGDFPLMEEKLYELMLQIIGITAQGTGQTVAASTSATQIQDNRLTENKVYEYAKERMHHGLTRLFKNGYSDDIIEGITQNNIISVTGDTREIRDMDKILIDNAINAWVVKTKEQTGLYPMEEEIAIARQNIENDLEQFGNSRFPEIKKELFKISHFIEWNFVDESVDRKQRIDTLSALANEAKSDPNSDISVNKIREEQLNLVGLDAKNYKKSPEEKLEEQRAAQEQMIAEQGINQPVMA